MLRIHAGPGRVSKRGRSSAATSRCSLRDAVAAVGRELGMPAPDAFATLVGAWPAIVGERARAARFGALGP